MSMELDQRVWSVLEQGLVEFEGSTQARPELWPLVRQCLSLLLTYSPERIIAGVVNTHLNTEHLMAWIIVEGRELELGEESTLNELEACWNQWKQNAHGCAWSHKPTITLQ